MGRWALPKDLRYSPAHTWARAEGRVATVGLTDFAQAESHRIGFVGLPRVGEGVRRGEPCGYIFSVTQGIWGLYSPVDGRVVTLNEEIWAYPDLAQEGPYGDGWLFQVEMENPGELDELAQAADYAHWLDIAFSRHPERLLPQPAEGEEPAAWMVIEEDRKIVVCGLGSERLTGWEPWELAGRQTCIGAYGCRDAEGPVRESTCPGLACFRKMGPVKEARYTILTQTGEALAIQASYSVVPAPLGQPRRALVHMRAAVAT